MAEKKRTRRKKAAPRSLGLTATETVTAPEGAIRDLGQTIEADGGAVLGTYREPYGGSPVLLVALPIDRIEPTPYQRDASEAHVKRLMGVIEKIGQFLDPVIAIRHDDAYWTPNGNHRLQALRKLGAKAVTALLVPEPSVAFKILALNTEKAHNLREKSLETVRMARALAGMPGKESDYAFEFDEPSLLTLGLCYEQRPRFSGSAYQPVLKRVEAFFEKPIREALELRAKRSHQALSVDDAVAGIVGRLQERGFKSPYLKSFVIARINPIRFSKASSFDFDEVMSKMAAAAGKFNVEKVKQEDIARTGGVASEE